MTRPLVREHNLATGEIIEREMNDEEFAQSQIDKAEHEAELSKKAEAEVARQALLAKLDITEEEARLLLGGN